MDAEKILKRILRRGSRTVELKNIRSFSHETPVLPCKERPLDNAEPHDTFTPKVVDETSRAGRTMKSVTSSTAQASKAILGGDKKILAELEERMIQERTLWEFKKYDIHRHDAVYDSANKTLYTLVGFDAGLAPPTDPFDREPHHLSNLYATAFNPDGSVKWAFQDARPVCSPVIDDHGNVYVRSSDKLFTLDSKGKVIATYDTGPNDDFWSGYSRDRAPAWLSTPPVTGKDGEVYVLTGHRTKYDTIDNDLRLLCLKDGREMWHYDSVGGNNYYPAVAAAEDGTVHLSCAHYRRKRSIGGLLGDRESHHCLVSLKPDGSEKHRIPVDNWNLNYGMSYRKNVATGPDSTTYASHDWDRIDAFTPGGKKKWTWQAQLPSGLKTTAWAGICEAPAFDRDGNIYIATFASKGENRYEYSDSAPGCLVKLDRNGHELWSASLPPGGAIAAPQVGRDGNIYVKTARGYLKIFDDQGGEKGSFRTCTSTDIAIGDDGELFLSGWDSIMALQPDGSKLPERPHTQESIPSGPQIDMDEEFVVIDGLKLNRRALHFLGPGIHQISS